MNIKISLLQAQNTEVPNTPIQHVPRRGSAGPNAQEPPSPPVLPLPLSPLLGWTVMTDFYFFSVAHVT